MGHEVISRIYLLIPIPKSGLYLPLQRQKSASDPIVGPDWYESFKKGPIPGPNSYAFFESMQYQDQTGLFKS